jgi:probable rRNA maturation factor
MATSLRNRQSALRINELKLKRRLGAALTALGRPKSSLSVLITDDEGIRALNREFRGRDAPTNVLAFPFHGEPRGPSAPPPPKTLPPSYLGDIAVSAQAIAREAAEGGHQRGFLLYFYLIHGLLHLVGFDHELGEEEERAQEAEAERLMALIPHSLL